MLKIKLISLFISFNLIAGIKVGTELPELILKGENGTIDGKNWSSKSFETPINVFFYVDPDERDANEEISEILADKKYPKNKVTYFGAINYDATFLPNFLLSNLLKQKQKKYPDTIYLKDYDKTIVSQWNLKDDSNTFTILDKDSKVLFSKFGKLTKGDIKKVLQIIESKI